MTNPWLLVMPPTHSVPRLEVPDPCIAWTLRISADVAEHRKGGISELLETGEGTGRFFSTGNESVLD